MKSSSLIAVGSFVVAAALTAACATENNAKDVPTEAEMMERWTAYMTPGPEHKILDAKVGHWSTHGRYWMGADTPAEEYEGTSEIAWVMGGRYINESHHGSMMGQPYESTGVNGFDNLKRKYFGAWIDNMGTGLMTSEGSYDASKKTFTYSGSAPDVTMTKEAPMRIVEILGDPSSFKMEMFAPDVHGKEYKMMELVYTRTK